MFNECVPNRELQINSTLQRMISNGSVTGGADVIAEARKNISKLIEPCDRDTFLSQVSIFLNIYNI